MKYYKRLAKNKPSVLAVLLIWDILCIAGLVISMRPSSGGADYTIPGEGIVTLLSRSNAGMAALSLLNLYFALVWLPSVSVYAQDPAEYEFLEEECGMMRVRHGGNEWRFDPQHIKTDSWFWKDYGGKFCTARHAYQVSGYAGWRYSQKGMA